MAVIAFSNNMKIYSFPILPSTNACAMEDLKNEKMPFGVFAYEQSHGKGQQGKTWLSEAGKNILFSWVYQPQTIEISQQFWISQAFSLGVLDFLQLYIKKASTSNPLRIKWPNDIYVGSEKIAGILIENKIMDGSIAKTVIGIGMNINQVSFDPCLPNPTSLAVLTSKTYSLNKLLSQLVKCIHSRLCKEDADLQQEYLSNLLNYKIQANYIYKGKSIDAQIVGVNAFGHLHLKCIKGEEIWAELKELVFVF